MCGRFSCTLHPFRLRRIASSSKKVLFRNVEKYRPKYNFTPQTYAPIILEDEKKGECEVVMALWGGIRPPAGSTPKATEEEASNSPYNTINARSEAVCSSPLYGGLIKSKRCVVVVDGFYEWKTKRLGDKVVSKHPYFIRVKEDAQLAKQIFSAEKGATEGLGFRKSEPSETSKLNNTVEHQNDSKLKFSDDTFRDKHEEEEGVKALKEERDERRTSGKGDEEEIPKKIKEEEGRGSENSKTKEDETRENSGIKESQRYMKEELMSSFKKASSDGKEELLSPSKDKDPSKPTAKEFMSVSATSPKIMCSSGGGVIAFSSISLDEFLKDCFPQHAEMPGVLLEELPCFNSTAYSRPVLQDDEPPLLMAGLYDAYEDLTSSKVVCVEGNEECRGTKFSFTVLTMDSGDSIISEIHTRMPVFLSPEAAADWLNHSCEYNFTKLQEVVRKANDFSNQFMRFYEVPNLVSSIRNNSHECVLSKDRYRASQLSKMYPTAAANSSSEGGAKKQGHTQSSSLEEKGGLGLNPEKRSASSFGWGKADSSALQENLPSKSSHNSSQKLLNEDSSRSHAHLPAYRNSVCARLEANIAAPTLKRSSLEGVTSDEGVRKRQKQGMLKITDFFTVNKKV